MAAWITEGTAHRSPVRRVPVMHLLVRDPEVEWRMWCSYGQGRKDSGYPQCTRCRKCRKLAGDAVANGDLDADDEAIVNWHIKPQEDAR